MTKITELTSLTAPASGDYVLMVDVSDTSQGAGGTTKKVPMSYFLLSGGDAVLITGGGQVVLAGYTATVAATGTASVEGHTHVQAEITDYDPAVALATGVSDATIDTPADDEVLAYDTANSDWRNQTAAEAGLAEAVHTHVEADITDLGAYLESVAVADLSDATITAVADDEVLAYDSGSGEWINQTAAEAGLAEDVHTHVEADITDLGSYEPELSDPGTDDYILSSTAAGVRSWVENATGAPSSYYTHLITPYFIGVGANSTVYTTWNDDGYFYFHEDMVPAGMSVYFQAWIAGAGAYTINLRIVDSSGTEVTGSELTGSGSNDRHISGAITLTTGWYRIQYKTQNGFTNANIYRVELVFT